MMAKKQPEDPELVRLRTSIMSKIDRLSGARQNMSIEQLKNVEEHLMAALSQTAGDCREELERFAHLLLTFAGRNPLEEGKGLSDDQIVSLNYRIRPSIREILEQAKTVQETLT